MEYEIIDHGSKVITNNNFPSYTFLILSVNATFTARGDTHHRVCFQTGDHFKGDQYSCPNNKLEVYEGGTDQRLIDILETFPDDRSGIERDIVSKIYDVKAKAQAQVNEQAREADLLFEHDTNTYIKVLPGDIDEHIRQFKIDDHAIHFMESHGNAFRIQPDQAWAEKELWRNN